MVVFGTVLLGACQRQHAPYLSSLDAGKGFPLYTTYAAAPERSHFVLDQGYTFQYDADSLGADFTTDTGGDIALGFRLGDRYVYRVADMHRPPTITASYPDMVRYNYQPFAGIEVEAWFVVHSSTMALLDLQIANQADTAVALEVFPYMRHASRTFQQVESHGRYLLFEHQEYPDAWTLNHDVPYTDSIRNIWLASETPTAAGAFTSEIGDLPAASHPVERATFLDFTRGAARETLAGGVPHAKVVAFEHTIQLAGGGTENLRFVRGVAPTAAPVDSLVGAASELLDQPLEPYQQQNEAFFAHTPKPDFGDPDKDALYWSAASMMRQVFYPAEGNSSYNYYVFSREPTWGWGHGGQVFHESIAMLAYADIDPQGAMNSQRVYRERQYPNGYINYRTGGYLDEIIEHNGQLTTSAPWYAWLNWEVYRITRDTTFLREMYGSSKKLFRFIVDNRDSDDDGLCEWGGHAVLESVRDAQVAVWDEVGFPTNFESLDLNCMLVKEAKSLEQMARALGLVDEAAVWRTDHERRTQLINDTFWDETNGFYYQVDKNTHTFTHKETDDLKRDEIIGFLPLWAGVADEQRATRLVGKLTDTAQFWREYGVPTLSAQDSYYNDKGYWNGPVWVQWNYLIMLGLQDYGYHEEARALVDRVVAGMVSVLKDNHNLWEFYSPDEPWGGYHKTYIWAGIINRMMMDTQEGR